MRPQDAYVLLNRRFWLNRLPNAKIELVENSVIPTCWGLTLVGDQLARPIVLINEKNRKWEITLLHEMVHLAEPELPEGKLFDALVRHYWNRARPMRDRAF